MSSNILAYISTLDFTNRYMEASTSLGPSKSFPLDYMKGPNSVTIAFATENSFRIKYNGKPQLQFS